MEKLESITVTFSGAILERIYEELAIAHLEPEPDEQRIKEFILQMVEMGMNE